jgi:hypothetical protein
VPEAIEWDETKHVPPERTAEDEGPGMRAH